VGQTIPQSSEAKVNRNCMTLRKGEAGPWRYSSAKSIPLATFYELSAVSNMTQITVQY
jgi:hypothetical protein